MMCWKNFNSRPSARGDAATRRRFRRRSNFNSRPSARGDKEELQKRQREYISIHAPPRGATTLSRRFLLSEENFNSRPSARGDLTEYNTVTGLELFQFTPLREGRPEKRAGLKAFTTFQFTPLREGRPRSVAEHLYKCYFNSRPSARGDALLSDGACKSLYFNSRPSARGDGKRYAISANLLFNPYKSAWLNNRATQFVEIILVIFHRIIA